MAHEEVDHDEVAVRLEARLARRRAAAAVEVRDRLGDRVERPELEALDLAEEQSRALPSDYSILHRVTVPK
jgi:hypothetical protein